MSLAGKQILVVRPHALKGEPDSFVAQLSDANATVHHLPVMELQALESGQELAAAKSAVINLDHFNAAIFVSRPAVTLGLELIDCYWPQLPVTTDFYAVGESSAAELRAFGIEPQLPDADPTSEGLLKLPSLQALEHQKILIFRGLGGREYLSQQLQQRGAEVTYAELYQRALTRQHLEEIFLRLDDGLDGLVVHSGALLQMLLEPTEGETEHIRLKLIDIPLLVPSKRVAELANDAGFKQVITADSALPADMVSALQRWYSDFSQQ